MRDVQDVGVQDALVSSSSSSSMRRVSVVEDGWRVTGSLFCYSLMLPLQQHFKDCRYCLFVFLFFLSRSVTVFKSFHLSSGEGGARGQSALPW